MTFEGAIEISDGFFLVEEPSIRNATSTAVFHVCDEEENNFPTIFPGKEKCPECGKRIPVNVQMLIKLSKGNYIAPLFSSFSVKDPESGW